MLTVLEMVLRDLLSELEPGGPCALDPAACRNSSRRSSRRCSPGSRPRRSSRQLAAVVEMEEAIYRSGHKNNYYADRFGIDVLTDTTERSPTYCTPPFRKFDDAAASESWAFLFVPDETTPAAWERLIRRRPACVEWSEAAIRALVAPDALERTLETVRKIGCRELMRFKVGMDGLPCRRLGPGDSAAAIVAGAEVAALGFARRVPPLAARGGPPGRRAHRHHRRRVRRRPWRRSHGRVSCRAASPWPQPSRIRTSCSTGSPAPASRCCSTRSPPARWSAWAA